MATLSGQQSVSSAGTAERLHTNLLINAQVIVKARSGNSGAVYLGNVDGDVDSSNGLELLAGEQVVFVRVGNLREIWIDAENNGDGVAWLVLDF